MDLREKIIDLKERYGHVFQVEIEDMVFLFRPLTRREYARILAYTSDRMLQDELVCQTAVVYPEGIDFSACEAGIASTLAPYIINESGFGNLQRSHDYFTLYKEAMNSFDMQAEAVIQAAFPSITEEEMKDWTVDKLMRMLAKAEWILREVKGYKHVEFQEIKEERKETEPMDFKKIGDELRKEGIDPMLALADQIVKPPTFTEFPFIAGVQYWRRSAWSE